MPSVSAIVATHNRPAMADEALQSIRKQILTPDEIIIADDGNDGAGRDLAARHEARLVETAGVGPAQARNAAARLAKGDWLAFCDDDDAWLPERLALQLAAVVGPCVLLYGDAERSDGRREWEGRNPSAGHVFGSLLLDNWVPTSTVLLRRDAFEQCGGFQSAYEPAEDYHLWLNVSRLGPFVRIDRPLATYRVHRDQLQSRVAPMSGATARVVEEALANRGWTPQQIPNLARRLRQLRFVEGRALMAEGNPAAARVAYRCAWRHQRAYLPAPLFWVLSFLGR